MAAPEAPDLKQQLYELLARAGSPAGWPPLACSAGPLTRIGPGLHVAGSNGPLKLPLLEEQAAAIKAAASGDGGGGGGVWVLPAAQLEVTNPRWEGEVVVEAARRAKASLDLMNNTRVEARLSRLELHEAGSTLEPVARPPTSDDMFGELAILLPSPYQGGQLRVLHNGWEEQVDLAARNAKSSCFAAFYSGCHLGTLPLVGGHRCLLFYDLIWAGGSKPPQLPPDRAARLLEVSQQWSSAADAPMRYCFMLQNRYGETELRERGIQALQGADEAAAQALLSACERGAELDVSLALVKATAVPGVDRYEVLDDVCEQYDVHRCPGCGDYHFGDFGVDPRTIHSQVDRIYSEVVLQNKPYASNSDDTKPRWRHVKAAKFVGLTGQCPLEPMLVLQMNELLHNEAYFSGPPNRAVANKHADIYIMQWRRVGLLVSPRSMRLRNRIHSNLARQTVRLHDKLGLQPDSLEISSLRLAAAMSGPQGGWLAHESMGYFQGSPADRADGFDSPLQETAVPDELQVSPWELAEAIAAYLAAPGSRLVAGADHSLSTLMRLGATQQLTGLKPPGDSILVPSLLKAATAAFAHSMLAPAAIRLLQHHRWPASAVPALQQWAYPSRSGFESGLALLEACLADAESASGQDSTDALAAASALALSLAKALRQGSAPAYQYSFTSVFQQIAKPLLLLHRVSTPAGRLALETAVDVVLDVSEGRPLSSRNQYGLSVGLLQSGCVAILRALSADVVAEAPLNWSKVFTFPWAPAGDPRHQLQEFAFSPDRQQCVLPCTPRLDAIVEDYLNEDMREQAPKWRDLDAERVQLEGGADGWRFTKSHKAYQQEVAEHAEQRQKLEGLLQLLLPCLVLVLPCGGSSLSAGAAEDEAPPAKAPRLA